MTDRAPEPALHPTASALVHPAPELTTQTGQSGDDPGPPPARFGRYELRGEIARGGMGIIYAARDTVFDREVAIKALAARYGPDSPAADRFTDEARITGQLQHPGIPAAHDLGRLPDGRPYLAMKLIKGRTLEQLLSDRADPAADRGRFLPIFEQMCQAVGYAHAHRVIHRDLKPLNVMVGAYGEVQVMDWGLAKVLGAEPPGPSRSQADTAGTEIRSARGGDAFTEAGSLLGTPAYMPPEQAIGAIDRIDERSDVFGLGAVLAVILTGRPPYVGESREMIRQLAARARLDGVYARLATCGAEPGLVALARRCLAAEQVDRPADAGEVAREVAALRADSERRARQAELDRATAEVRAAEEVKRRRVRRAAGGLLILALLAGGLTAAWQWRRTQDALTGEKGEREKASAALAAAVDARGRTVAALRVLTDQAVEERIARQSILTDRDRQFFRDVQRLWEELAESLGDTEEARAMRALGAYRVAFVQNKLGELPEAEAGYRRALDLGRALVADFPPNTDHRNGLAFTLFNLGSLLEATNRVPEAERAYAEALDLWRQLAAEVPANRTYRERIAGLSAALGNVYRDSDRRPEAERAYQESLDLRLALTRDFPTDANYRDGLARTYTNLGRFRDRTRRPGEAEQAFRDALAVQRQLDADFPGNPDHQGRLAQALADLAYLLRRTGRMPEAEPLLGEAVRVRRALATDYPVVADYQTHLAAALMAHGSTLGPLKREEAEQVTRDALDIYRRLVARSPGDGHENQLAGTLVNLASLIRARSPREARRLLEQAVPYHVTAVAARPDDPTPREFFRNNRWAMAETLLALGDHAAVPKCTAEMLEHSRVPRLDTYAAAGFLARCVPLAERDPKLPGPRRPETAWDYADRAMTHLQRAVRIGYRDGRRMAADPALAPLRGRDDFRRLWTDLWAAGAPREPGPMPRPVQ